MGRAALETILSLVFLTLFLYSHTSVISASASSEETKALLKWKASFENRTQSRLASWTLLSQTTTNFRPGTSRCTWFGISCNIAETLSI